LTAGVAHPGMKAAEEHRHHQRRVSKQEALRTMAANPGKDGVVDAGCLCSNKISRRKASVFRMPIIKQSRRRQVLLGQDCRLDTAAGRAVKRDITHQRKLAKAGTCLRHVPSRASSSVESTYITAALLRRRPALVARRRCRAAVVCHRRGTALGSGELGCELFGHFVSTFV